MPISVPSQASSNQRTVVPKPPVTDRLIMPASSSQKSSLSDCAEAGATGRGITVTAKVCVPLFPQTLLA